MIHGTAALDHSADTLFITASDQAILHWRDFSIEENETARFILPASDSSILNRVTDAYPSRLLGKIEANGRVLLINPNGVLVGANAQIDAGAFIASSLDVLDSAYLEKSELAFSGCSDASVANHGRIVSSTGEIFLLGRHVENHGSLSSRSDAGAIAAARASLRPAAGGWHLVGAEGQKLDSPSIALIAGSIHAAGRHAVVLGDWVEL